jgi:hypothetical protein
MMVCALLAAAGASSARADSGPLVLSNGLTLLAFQGAASGFALAGIRSAATDEGKIHPVDPTFGS